MSRKIRGHVPGRTPYLGGGIAESRAKVGVSPDWVLSQLAGMRFPEQGSAYDYMKRSLMTASTCGAKPVAPEVVAPSVADARSRFQACCVQRARQVDDNDVCDWTDLAYGFLLALGFPPGDDTYAVADGNARLSARAATGDDDPARCRRLGGRPGLPGHRRVPSRQGG